MVRVECYRANVGERALCRQDKTSQAFYTSEYCRASMTPTVSRRSSARSLRVYASDNYNGVHHVGLLCKDISDSMRFYKDILGMEINEARPNDKLPYKGAWLWVGDEMIHLMELPNPDPEDGRPEHGGRDRHVCLSVKSIEPLESMLKQHGIEYTKSKSGRAALFFRDPDQNVLEMAEQ